MQLEEEHQTRNMFTSSTAFVRNAAVLLWAFPTYFVQFLRDFLDMGLSSAKCASTARLDGKVAVITGCNTGIGKYTAMDFFQRGARVIMACRNLEAANEALEHIKSECTNLENCGEIRTASLDLSSIDSIKKCANHLLETEQRINLLINNAGVMMCPYSKSMDGYEMQFATNHLGHFLFTLLLMPKIIPSAPARIVTVSSMAHRRGTIDFDDLNWENKTYDAFRAYEQSKLANVLFSRELARKLKDANVQNVNTYSLHPGVIATDLGRHLGSYIPSVGWLWRNFLRIFFKTPLQGCQTTIYCAVDEKCENETGLYYAECRVKNPANIAHNEEIARKLWDASWKLVKLDKKFNPFKI